MKSKSEIIEEALSTDEGIRAIADAASLTCHNGEDRERMKKSMIALMNASRDSYRIYDGLKR